MYLCLKHMIGEVFQLCSNIKIVGPDFPISVIDQSSNSSQEKQNQANTKQNESNGEHGVRCWVDGCFRMREMGL